MSTWPLRASTRSMSSRMVSYPGSETRALSAFSTAFGFVVCSLRREASSRAAVAERSFGIVAVLVEEVAPPAGALHARQPGGVGPGERLESERKRRRATRRERQPRLSVVREVVSVRGRLVDEVERLPVALLRRKAVRELEPNDLAADVGSGDVEVDAVAGVDLRWAGHHLPEGIQEDAVHPLAIEQRDGRILLDQASEAFERRPVIQELAEVALFDPELGDGVERAALCEGAGEEDPVDAAGGCAADDIDDVARERRRAAPHAGGGRAGTPTPRGEPAVDPPHAVEPLRRKRGASGTVLPAATGAHEREHPLGHTADVNRQRHAAVHD